jgi:hypothetical protein
MRLFLTEQWHDNRYMFITRLYGRVASIKGYEA